MNIRYRFQQALNKLEHSDTRERAMKEIKNLIEENQQQTNIPLFIDILCKNQKRNGSNKNHNMIDQEILLIGYLSQVYKEKLIDPNDKPPSLKKTVNKLINGIQSYFKEKNASTQIACAKALNDIYENTLKKQSQTLILNLLFDNLIDILLRGEDRLTQSTASICLHEFIQLLEEQNQNELLEQMQGKLFSLLTKIKFDFSEIYQAAIIIGFQFGLQFFNHDNQIRKLTKKLLQVIQTESQSNSLNNFQAYNTKIQACRLLELIADSIQSEGSSSLIIGIDLNVLTKALDQVSKHRVATIQKAGKNALNAWNIMIQFIQQQNFIEKKYQEQINQDQKDGANQMENIEINNENQNEQNQSQNELIVKKTQEQQDQEQNQNVSQLENKLQKEQLQQKLEINDVSLKNLRKARKQYKQFHSNNINNNKIDQNDHFIQNKQKINDIFSQAKGWGPSSRGNHFLRQGSGQGGGGLHNIQNNIQLPKISPSNFKNKQKIEQKRTKFNKNQKFSIDNKFQIFADQKSSQKTQQNKDDNQFILSEDTKIENSFKIKKKQEIKNGKKLNDINVNSNDTTNNQKQQENNNQFFNKSSNESFESNQIDKIKQNPNDSINKFDKSQQQEKLQKSNEKDKNSNNLNSQSKYQNSFDSQDSNETLQEQNLSMESSQKQQSNLNLENKNKNKKKDFQSVDSRNNSNNSQTRVNKDLDNSSENQNQYNKNEQLTQINSNQKDTENNNNDDLEDSLEMKPRYKESQQKDNLQKIQIQPQKSPQNNKQSQPINQISLKTDIKQLNKNKQKTSDNQGKLQNCDKIIKNKESKIEIQQNEPNNQIPEKKEIKSKIQTQNIQYQQRPKKEEKNFLKENMNQLNQKKSPSKNKQNQENQHENFIFGEAIVEKGAQNANIRKNNHQSDKDKQIKQNNSKNNQKNQNNININKKNEIQSSEEKKKNKQNKSKSVSQSPIQKQKKDIKSKSKLKSKSPGNICKNQNLEPEKKLKKNPNKQIRPKTGKKTKIQQQQQQQQNQKQQKQLENQQNNDEFNFQQAFVEKGDQANFPQKNKISPTDFKIQKQQDFLSNNDQKQNQKFQKQSNPKEMGKSYVQMKKQINLDDSGISDILEDHEQNVDQLNDLNKSINSNISQNNINQDEILSYSRLQYEEDLQKDTKQNLNSQDQQNQQKQLNTNDKNTDKFTKSKDNSQQSSQDTELKKTYSNNALSKLQQLEGLTQEKIPLNESFQKEHEQFKEFLIGKTDKLPEKIESQNLLQDQNLEENQNNKNNSNYNQLSKQNLQEKNLIQTQQNNLIEEEKQKIQHDSILPQKEELEKMFKNIIQTTIKEEFQILNRGQENLKDQENLKKKEDNQNQQNQQKLLQKPTGQLENQTDQQKIQINYIETEQTEKTSQDLIQNQNHSFNQNQTILNSLQNTNNKASKNNSINISSEEISLLKNLKKNELLLQQNQKINKDFDSEIKKNEQKILKCDPIINFQNYQYETQPGQNFQDLLSEQELQLLKMQQLIKQKEEQLEKLSETNKTTQFSQQQSCQNSLKDYDSILEYQQDQENQQNWENNQLNNQHKCIQQPINNDEFNKNNKDSKENKQPISNLNEITFNRNYLQLNNSNFNFSSTNFLPLINQSKTFFNNNYNNNQISEQQGEESTQQNSLNNTIEYNSQGTEAETELDFQQNSINLKQFQQFNTNDNYNYNDDKQKHNQKQFSNKNKHFDSQQEEIDMEEKFMEILKYYQQKDYNQAYELAFQLDDDIYTMRLMMMTGPCAGKLSKINNQKLMQKVNTISRSSFLKQIGLNIQQEAENLSLIDNLPLEVVQQLEKLQNNKQI